MLFARTLILIMNTLTFLIRNLHKHWTCSQECVKFLETLSMSREFKEKKKKKRETTSCNRGMHHCTQTHQRLSKPNINCLSKIQTKYFQTKYAIFSETKYRFSLKIKRVEFLPQTLIFKYLYLWNQMS